MMMTMISDQFDHHDDNDDINDDDGDAVVDDNDDDDDDDDVVQQSLVEVEWIVDADDEKAPLPISLFH